MDCTYPRHPNTAYPYARQSLTAGAILASIEVAHWSSSGKFRPFANIELRLSGHLSDAVPKPINHIVAHLLLSVLSPSVSG